MTRLPLLAAALALALPATALAGPVTVDLTGLRAGGTLYVQLQTREQFLGSARVAGRVVTAPQAGRLSVDLGEVAPGDYAITVWHDGNNNNRFEMPGPGGAADGWAIANGERLRGEPSFDVVKFAVPAAAVQVPLALFYGP